MPQEKARNKRKLSRKQLDEIAEPEGFRFLKVLGGYGSYHLYTNGELLRTYDPKTGKTIGKDYAPKGRTTTEFNNPAQIPTNASVRKYFGTGLNEN